MPHTDTLIGVALSDRYRLEHLASEEMLGRVYVARDLKQGHLVQVKVLHPHLVGNDEKFKRFGRELTATRMVRHPNTVEVLDWGTHGEIYYIVLEYLAAYTLQEEIDQGPLQIGRAAHIAAQMASAIGAAHQENIVHRNLSPSNVLLLDNASKGAYVKVRDFGLSRLEKFDDEATNLTAMGARVGNIHYMPPEYIEANRVHPKGDLYALGAVLFQMLTGRTPYVGRAADVLGWHVTDPVPNPSDVSPGIPSWADEVVQTLMAKEPEERPGAYAVVKLLEEGVGHELGPPKLLGIDADGHVVPKSKAPLAIVAMGALVLLFGMASMGVVGAAGFGYLLWTSVPEITLAPADGPDEGLVPTDRAAPPPPAPVEETRSVPDPSEPAPAARPSPRTSPTPAPVPEPSAPPAAGGDGSALSLLHIRATRRVLVYVDGVAVGYTPIDLPMRSGEHEVAALVPGDIRSRQTQSLHVAGGDDQTIEFVF